MLRRHGVDVRAHGRVGEARNVRVAVTLPVGFAVEGDPAGNVEWKSLKRMRGGMPFLTSGR